eukprot:5672339-Heterocapsa_arctica.AAC.1
MMSGCPWVAGDVLGGAGDVPGDPAAGPRPLVPSEAVPAAGRGGGKRESEALLVPDEVKSQALPPCCSVPLTAQKWKARPESCEDPVDGEGIR